MSEYDKAGFRYVFKHTDEVAADWLKKQSNKSFSLRWLIHRAINAFGSVDLQEYALYNFPGGESHTSPEVELWAVEQAAKSNRVKPELTKKLAEVKNAKAKPDKKIAEKPEVKPEIKSEVKPELKSEPKPAAEVKPPVNKPVEQVSHESVSNINNDPLFDDDGFVDPDTLWQD